MQDFVNKKVLITTTNWFFGPDGQQYRAVWGTLKAIHEVGKTLGFIPNRSHANWFVEVGKMVIMGCQVMYLIRCDDKPITDKEKTYGFTDVKGYVEYERPGSIYITD